MRRYLVTGGLYWKWYNRPKAHIERGYVLHNEGRYRDSVREFRAAVRLQPDQAKAHSDLADALECVNYRQEPSSRLGMVVVVQPAPPKELAEAVAEYHEAIRLDPRSPRYHADLADALDNQGKTTEAIAEYHKTITLLPAYAAMPLEQEVMTQANAQAHANANQHYHDACWRLAQDLQRQRKYLEAIHWFRKSIASMPDDTSTVMMLAKALKESSKTHDH